MTPALPRITENMAAFWRSRGRLADGLSRAVTAAGPSASEESVCLIDFFLATFVLHVLNAFGFLQFFSACGFYRW